jgi:hypothetical protein
MQCIQTQIFDCAIATKTQRGRRQKQAEGSKEAEGRRRKEKKGD